MTVSESEWIEAFAKALGVTPPTPDEREALLSLAGVAAHASERTAAPLSCFLTARAGLDAEAAKALAEQVAQTLEAG
jgi:hypothetical protein